MSPVVVSPSPPHLRFSRLTVELLLQALAFPGTTSSPATLFQARTTRPVFRGPCFSRPATLPAPQPPVPCSVGSFSGPHHSPSPHGPPSLFTVASLASSSRCRQASQLALSGPAASGTCPSDGPRHSPPPRSLRPARLVDAYSAPAGSLSSVCWQSPAPQSPRPPSVVPVPQPRPSDALRLTASRLQAASCELPQAASPTSQR